MADWCQGGGSAASSESNVVTEKFPAGLRVLIVDDDRTCLLILEKKLLSLKYKVTKCNRAETALSLLRKYKNGFDMVISDVHMPDMDGLKLLEQVGLEMDLPVIMTSADDSVDVVMKGVTHGACDYLIKPVRKEALLTLWQHVVRKNSLKDLERSKEGELQQKDAEYSSSGNEAGWKNSRKRKNDQEEENDGKEDNTSTLKKPRVVWTAELHRQFVLAVNQLGLDKAFPKKILELMNVPWLTRENVASHLQKYRMYLRRLSEMPQQQDNMNHPFIGPIPSSSGDNGFQALVCPLPAAQTATTLQLVGGLGQPNANPGITVPVVGQRIHTIFGFENPRIRFMEGQTQNVISNGRQVNMQPPHAHMGPGSQTSGLPMQMAQPQSIEQLILSNRFPAAISGGSGVMGNIRGALGYNTVPQQASSLPNFPLNHNSSELLGNNLPVGSTAGISSQVSNGTFQENVNVNNCNVKVSGGITPSYDIFEDLLQADIDVQQPILVSQGLSSSTQQPVLISQGSSSSTKELVLVRQELSSSSTQIDGQKNSNVSLQGNGMTLPGEGSRSGNEKNMVQHFNTHSAENLARVKPEFPELPEDLISALLKPQEGIVPADNEFGFGGYSMNNNIRV